MPDSLLKSHKENKHVGGIFCYLDKVYDFANHKIILAMIHFCGIQGICGDVFKSCVTDRKQKME